MARRLVTSVRPCVLFCHSCESRNLGRGGAGRQRGRARVAVGWCRSERSEEPKAAAVMPHSGVSRQPPLTLRSTVSAGQGPEVGSQSAALGSSLRSERHHQSTLGLRPRVPFRHSCGSRNLDPRKRTPWIPAPRFREDMLRGNDGEGAPRPRVAQGTPSREKNFRRAPPYHQAVSSGSSLRASIASRHGPAVRYFQPPSAKMTTTLPSSMRWATL